MIALGITLIIAIIALAFVCHRYVGVDAECDKLGVELAIVRSELAKERGEHSGATADLILARADAIRLADCVRAYLKQMDEYSMRLGEEPCKLSREREALLLHQQLIESENVQPSKTETTA